MRKLIALLLFGVSLVVANVVTLRTLDSNLAAGLYPVDAYSIGIPIFEGILTSVVIVIFVATALAVPQRRKVFRGLSLVLYILASVVAVLKALSWTVPNHSSIAISYGVIVIACAGLIIFFGRRPASNITVERDASPQSGSRPSP